MNKPIELLAPAGNKDAFLAAIVAGADAIYFGLEEFNARKRAENIKIADLPLLCAAAHVRNCMCYMTLNILFFDDEFEQIHSLVDTAVKAGIDAIIVQDIGAIHFLEQNFPSLPVHVSTQVTVHNIAQIDFLAQFKNVAQVNLSRELSLVDIKLITAKLAEYNLKSEIFVHGSYCISYSGQCYMSGLLYGEAGNRGECVQPCRRAYTADYSESEGSETEFKPFNLKDNSAFNLAAELAQTGADSFKIEGRIKSAEYVWAVVSAWRQKIDQITGNVSNVYKPVNLKSAKTLLDGCFNRGFTDDYLKGHASSDMFASQNGNADEKDKSVFSVGTVISYTSDTKQLVLREHENSRNMQGLEKGTKITIRNTDASFVCSGEITNVVSKPGFKTGNATYELHLTSKPDAKNPLRISRGQLVTAQPVLIAADTLKQLCADMAASGNRALNDKGSNGGSSLTIVVSGVTGEKLVAQFDAGNGQSVLVSSESVLSQAQNQGMSKDTLISKLCAFGGTQYELESLDCSALQGMEAGNSTLFLPLKELKAMRRKAVEQLDAAQSSDKIEHADSSNIHTTTATEEEQVSVGANSNKTEQNFAAIYDTIETLESERNIPTKVGEIEYEISYRILEMPLEWGKQVEEYLLTNKDVIPLFSAILFVEDLERAEKLLSKLATGQLVWCENTGLAFLAQKKGLRVIAGSNFNTTNEHTVEAYRTLLGCDAVVLSPEKSLDNLTKLSSKVKIWCSLTSNQLLMQSKQCLTKNIPDENGKLCLKKDCDRDCLLTCRRQVKFKDSQHNHLIGVNRPGFYSALYEKEPLNRQSLLNTPYGQKLNGVIDTWLIDARKF